MTSPSIVQSIQRKYSRNSKWRTWSLNLLQQAFQQSLISIKDVTSKLLSLIYIGLLLVHCYLTGNRPNFMFSVYLCTRHHSSLPKLHLQTIKSFKYTTKILLSIYTTLHLLDSNIMTNIKEVIHETMDISVKMYNKKAHMFYIYFWIIIWLKILFKIEVGWN